MFYIYYLALYFGMGVLFTFQSVFFAEHTPLTAEQVTRMLSFAPIVSFLSQNTFAYISDRTQKHKSVLIFVILGTIAGSLLVSWIASLNNFTLTIIAYFLFAFFYPSLGALSENFTLEYSKINNIPYGRIRLFGSLGFAIAGQVAGIITGRYGLPIIFYVFALCTLIPLLLAPRFSNIE
ncbi:MAG TPA: MFS transporter, partial [Atopostipes sp.]|nr:MFS transporter [Atopostipes sp.]